jgi:hypothetical protein
MVIAYIHNNPVRAGVVAKASDSSWTSHRAYVGSSKPPQWLKVDHGYELMNITEPADFDTFVNAESPRPRDARRRRGRPAAMHRSRR